VRGTEKPLSKEKKRRRGRGGTRKGRSRITTSIGVLGKPNPARCTVPAERKEGKESVRRARRKLSEALFVDRKVKKLKEKVADIQSRCEYPGKAKGVSCLFGRIAQLQRGHRSLESVASSVRGLERRGAVIRRANEDESRMLGVQIPPPPSLGGNPSHQQAGFVSNLSSKFKSRFDQLVEEEVERAERNRQRLASLGFNRPPVDRALIRKNLSARHPESE